MTGIEEYDGELGPIFDDDGERVRRDCAVQPVKRA
jgi:hypothetical protein